MKKKNLRLVRETPPVLPIGRCAPSRSPIGPPVGPVADVSYCYLPV